MQGNPDDYEKWLDEQKNPKFSNFRLFAGGFCVWALLIGAFVWFGWAEAKAVSELFFSCCSAAMAVVWLKGK